MRLPTLLLVAAALGGAAACDSDGATQGHRTPCATPPGVLVGCEDARVETPEDACWKLVECGSIALESDGFDWGECVEDIERIPETHIDFVLSCIEVATCDELRASGSPNRPDEDEIACFAHGEQG